MTDPTGPDRDSDAAVFAQLRAVWERFDPEPADLIDRMVADVAASDLSREYELLLLVEQPELAEVRGEAETLTLQFSDGAITVLVHVSDAPEGKRRVDGWVDGDVSAASIVQNDVETTASTIDGGRFSFDAVPSGVSRIRLAASGARGARELQTPQFEI